MDDTTTKAKDLQARRVVLSEERGKYEALKARIGLLQHVSSSGGSSSSDPTPSSMEVSVDVGAGFSVKARVSDVSKVYVDVGAGVQVPMTLDAASTFCDSKLGLLDDLTDETNRELQLMVARKFDEEVNRQEGQKAKGRKTAVS